MCTDDKQNNKRKLIPFYQPRTTRSYFSSSLLYEPEILCAGIDNNTIFWSYAFVTFFSLFASSLQLHREFIGRPWKLRRNQERKRRLAKRSRSGKIKKWVWRQLMPWPWKASTHCEMRIYRIFRLPRISRRLRRRCATTLMTAALDSTNLTTITPHWPWSTATRTAAAITGRWALRWGERRALSLCMLFCVYLVLNNYSFCTVFARYSLTNPLPRQLPQS